ncbi:hypothetical protein [Sphingomonas faeni]|uniref:hypothetical protein n=1 Tax=Sphingomonas faeni TaxID=185950 RepID=UPI00335F50C4
MTKPHPHKPAPRPKPNAKTFGINALSIGTAAIGLGGALLAVFLRSKTNAEHAAPDLALDKPRPGATDRAPDAFRPDPTAVPTKAERESLRHATGPAPSFAADRGSTLG